MENLAFVFAGQGSQYRGMGKELYDEYESARAVFDIADKIRPNTSSQCFTASPEELSQTINTQPCTFCVDLAAACALKEEGITPTCIAGFSVGEIPALTFAEAISYEDGFKLICKRSEYMNETALKNKGGMAAILRIDRQELMELCKGRNDVWAVNLNCPGQTVVGGTEDGINYIIKAVYGKARAVRLKVSGPFHTPLMSDAALKLSEYLKSVSLKTPKIPVYANVTANLYENAEKVNELVVNQVKSPVLWEDTLLNMSKTGIHTFVEVGAGKTLSGLIKKTLPNARVFSVQNAEDVKTVCREITR